LTVYIHNEINPPLVKVQKAKHTHIFITKWSLQEASI